MSNTPDSRYRRRLQKRVKGKPSSTENQLGLVYFLRMSLAQIAKILVLIVLVIGIALLGFGSGLLAGYVSTAQRVDVSNIRGSLSQEETKILDKDNQLVDTLQGSGSKSEFVSYDELKDTYIDDAFITIEDERFETHPGIDVKRILGAVVSALMNGGTPTHGGSTITQQTIKMISGKDDISAQRKIQEWYNAIQLENTRSKAAIMEMYLNLVPMANNYEGVGAAARAYFNKPASQLTLAECALLAGIPNRPATYNPMNEYGRRNCLRRMRLILNTMLESGRISAQQYDEALNQEIVFDFSAQKTSTAAVHNWFVESVIDEVRQDLMEKKGYSRDLADLAIYRYGLTIETTMDAKAQSDLEAVFQDESLFIQDPSQVPDTPEHAQAGITVMDNREDSRGMVRAIVGGFGKKKANLVFNYATDAKRQPGSSIKPLLVYAPALEVGAISQATPFDDKEMFLDDSRPNTPYPLNYSRKYAGPVTLEYAILMSLNTIAADTFLNRLGIEVGLSYLKQCGIDRLNEPYVSTSLGGFEQGMSTWDMAGAYSVLANEGLYTKPTLYRRVLNQDGSILLDNTQRESHRVYKPATCYVLTQMLKKVAAVDWNYAQPSNTTAAGKTGTTEFYRDVWFCGYTPYYTASVWYGYPNASGRSTAVPEVDGKNPCRIWKAAMEKLHEGLPAADWARPEDVINMEVCKESGMIASESCKEKMNVLLIKGSPANPTEVCDLHKGTNNFGQFGYLPSIPGGLTPIPSLPGWGSNNSGFRPRN